MTSRESTFSYVVGGLGLLTLLSPLIIYIKFYSPGSRLQFFDELLSDTKRIFDNATAEGLLPSEMAQSARAQLQRYELLGDDVRTAKFRSYSPWQIMLSSLDFGGKSSRITRFSVDLNQLRVVLLTVSQEERQRRGECPIGDLPLYRGADRSQSSPADQAQIPPLPKHAPDISTSSDAPTSEGSTEISPRHSRYSVYRLLDLISGFFTRKSPNPRHQTSPEIGSISRSSTLVQHSTPKDSSQRLSWWRPDGWIRLGDGWNTEGDIEAGQLTSQPSSSDCANPFSTPVENQQTEMDITSVVALPAIL
ncbi:hypothetical protein H0H81_000867 [Sphagnurus paluster]|uniref:Uncharacterized protein n=1 Tax=Sphagnurus paluster TaxID=117069 RepID=A0A9P7KI25_9AGAR|nr:hypothetical protein H0H81_000867 [Sphagnurus paluster]